MKNATRAHREVQYATSDDAKRAKPRPDGKPYHLPFPGGLRLRIGATGAKTWKVKVQRNGDQTTVTLGHFPAMQVKQAQEAWARIRNTEDPLRARRVEKAQAKAEGTTLREVAAQAIEARSITEEWTAGVLDAVNSRVERYILPKLGDRAIADVTTDDVRAVVMAVHNKYARTAIFVKQHLSMICDYALASRMIPFNPVKQIGSYLPKHRRHRETPRPFVRTIDDARAVLRAVEARAPFISPWTLLALRLVALTAVRSNECLGARWSEIDFDKAVWTIPAERMKGKAAYKREHYVALSPQAIEVLQVARALRKNEFVFPSHRASSKTGSMDRGTLSRLLRMALAKAGIGGVLVPHGWRSTFMTIGNDADDGANFRVRDVMLAHSAFRDHAEERDARTGGAERHYNHARYMTTRHRLACEWADMLLPAGSPTALEVLTRVEVSGQQHIGGKGTIAARDALRAIEAPASNVVPLRRVAA